MEKNLTKQERIDIGKKLADKACYWFEEYFTLTKGIWAGKPFKLLPWQKNKIIRPLFGTIKKNGYRQYNTVYIEVPKKMGKALSINTDIPTFNGWKKMRDIQIGDKLFDENGNICIVQGVTNIMYDRPCYEIEFANNEIIIADKNHIWKTHTWRPWYKTSLKTTNDICETLKYQQGFNHRIRINKALKIENKQLLIDPYLLGVWLGDGDSDSARITISYKDGEIIDNIRNSGIEIYETKSSNNNTGYYHLGKKSITKKEKDNSINARLRKMNLLNNKHIPKEYLRASENQRLELLKGMMDTDGYCGKEGIIEYTTVSERLSNNIEELIRTLGIKVFVKKYKSYLYGIQKKDKYRIHFTAYKTNSVFKLKRKAINLKDKPIRKTRAVNIHIKNVKKIQSVPVKCIKVSSDSGMFLCSRSFIPTHNSPLGAAIALILLFLDKENGAEVYSAASDRDQASIVFNIAKEMVEYEPRFANRSKLIDSTKRIVHNNGSVYRVLSAEAYSKAGYNIHGCIFDELHTQPNRDLYDVLTQGAGDARKQPLWVFLTTAGFDRNSICWEVHEKALKILKGVIKDPTFLPVIYAAGEDEDWTDEKVWKKCNPSLGVTIDIEKVRNACKEAQDNPANENLFRRLRLNQWVKQSSRYIPMKKWKLCGKKFDPEILKGKPCYGGLDLASSTDLAAFVLSFEVEELIYSLFYFWVPGENVEKRVKKDKAPYDQWIKQGFIKATPGNWIDLDTIELDIIELSKIYDIRGIPFDRWGAIGVSQHLTNEGFMMIDFGQGYKSMSPPTKGLLGLIMKQRLRHGGNPVALWMADNLTVTQDAAANVKPDKVKSTERIDGITSLIMSIDPILRSEETESVYASRGVITIDGKKKEEEEIEPEKELESEENLSDVLKSRYRRYGD